jgi:predicted dehydrogenase
MSKRWRVAIVQDTTLPMLGQHGLHTAFRGLPEVEVVAHVDSNTEELAQRMAQTQALRHYFTCEEMLEREIPDIVVICSRHPADHCALIPLIAQRGCHIYCDKPLTSDLLEADEIVRTVEQYGIRLAMAHPARHDLAFQTMKRLMHSGAIGTPLCAIGYGKCDHRGGGEDLVVLGTHILDLMTDFFGAPQSVTARILTQGRPATRADSTQTVEPIGPVIGDDIEVSFQFANGMCGMFKSQRGLLQPGQRTPVMGLQVVGTEGELSLRFDDAARQPLWIQHSQPDDRDSATTPQQVVLHEDRYIAGASPLDYALCGQKNIPSSPWFLEANRFAAWDLIQSIAQNRQPHTNVYHARQVIEMIQGVFIAHLTQSAVTFPLSQRRHPLSLDNTTP